MDDKPLVLIIEDDEDLAGLFSDLIQHQGFTTDVIRDGELAVKKLAEVVPTVVILDLHLPNVSGLEILKQIRADDRLKKTRVVVVTADSSMLIDVKEQADYTLLKPVRYARIHHIIIKLTQAPS